jgi:hypothetical protein
MTIQEFIGKAVYDPTGTMIFAEQKTGHMQYLLDVRGWGAIQNLFKTVEEAEAFQDQIGRFVADAINEKLENNANNVN